MIFVTGATGFVGSFVVAELLARGHPVRALHRADATRAPRPLGEAPGWLADADPRASGRLELVEGDVASAETMRWGLEGATGVVHLASACSVDPEALRRTDLAGAARLRELVGDLPVVYLSSADVYGAPARCPMDEEHPTRPEHAYGAAKLACEQALVAGRGPRTTVLRAPYVLGPHPRLLGGFWGRVLREGWQRRGHRLPPRDEAWLRAGGCSWIDARDLAARVVGALERGGGGTWNAAAGQVRWVELLERSLSVAGVEGGVRFEEGAVGLPLYRELRALSASRLEQALALPPCRPLEHTLRDIMCLAPRSP